MENEGYVKTMKAAAGTAFVFLCMVVGFVTIWQVAVSSNVPSLSNPSEELSTSCREAGGVVIQGLTQHGDAYNRFTVCVPYEALTCIDVE